MNELVAYFVKMGMSPEIAVQIATQVTRQSPVTPPIANGVKMTPTPGAQGPDAVETLLMNKYGMDPHQAFAYAGKILAGTATGGRALQEEAMTDVSNREVDRLHGMKKYADDINAKNSDDLVRMSQMEVGRLHQLKLYGDAAHVLPENRTPAQNHDYNQVQDWARKRMIDDAQRQVNDNTADTAIKQESDQQVREAADKDSNQALDDSLNEYTHRVALNRKLGWTK